MNDLFDTIAPLDPPRDIMAEGAVLLRGAALPFEANIQTALKTVTA
jgi:alkylated DNA repair protein (DNA oxidative demethylase)